MQGDNFKTVVVTIGRNDRGKVIPLIEYTLRNVVLSSVSVGGGGGDKPVEIVTMNYNHITWDFNPQKSEGGQVKTSWDLSKNATA